MGSVHCLGLGFRVENETARKWRMKWMLGHLRLCMLLKNSNLFWAAAKEFESP